jgi:hypothetical protein
MGEWMISIDTVLSGYGEGEARDTAGDATLLLADDLVAAALKNIQRSKSAIEKQRDHAKQARRFNSGHHYEDADLTYLREFLKSSAAFNVAQKFIRAVSGLERRSREYVDFVPTEVTNVMVGMAGDFVSQAYQWVLNKCHGDDERSVAFADSLVDGLAWTETFLDTMTDPDGLVTLQRVDMMEMLWDTNARQTNVADKEWVARVRLVPFDVAKKRWPDSVEYLQRLRGGTEAQSTDEMTRGTLYEWAANMSPSGDRIDADVTGPRKAKDLIPIVDYQWKDYEKGWYFFDPLEKDDLWMSEDDFLAYKLKLHRLRLPEITDKVSQLKPRFRRILFAGKWRLFGPVDCPGPRFTYNAITGSWDDEDQVWLGFMSLLMDPQRFANTFLNQALELMKTQSKGGLFAEIDAFVNPAQAEQQYARSGAIIQLRKDGLTKIKERELPQTPAASLQLLQFCVGMLQEVTGVGPDTMGLSDGNTPTGTTQARARASTALLAPTFASLRRYRVDEALGIIDHLKYISDGRLIRVGGPETAQYLQLVRDPFLLRYDILLEEGDSDPNTKQRYFEAIMQITPMLIRTNQFIPELLDYFPLPRRVIEMLKQRIQLAQQQQMQMRAMGMDPTGRGKQDPPDIRQAKIQKLNADTSLQIMKAKTLEQRGKTGNVDQMLKVLVAQEQARQNAFAQQHQHNTLAKDTLETLSSVFPQPDVQPPGQGTPA